MKKSLKAIRIELNLNQDEMARRLGISTKTYQLREQYKVMMTAEELEKVSQMSGVPMDKIRIY